MREFTIRKESGIFVLYSTKYIESTYSVALSFVAANVNRTALSLMMQSLSLECK